MGCLNFIHMKYSEQFLVPINRCINVHNLVVWFAKKNVIGKQHRFQKNLVNSVTVRPKLGKPYWQGSYGIRRAMLISSLFCLVYITKKWHKCLFEKKEQWNNKNPMLTESVNCKTIKYSEQWKQLPAIGKGWSREINIYFSESMKPGCDIDVFNRMQNLFTERLLRFKNFTCALGWLL